MSSAQDMYRLASAALDGELPPTDRDRLDAAVEQDPDLAAWMEQAARVAVWHGQIQPEIPAIDREQALADIRAEMRAPALAEPTLDDLLESLSALADGELPLEDEAPALLAAAADPEAADFLRSIQDARELDFDSLPFPAPPPIGEVLPEIRRARRKRERLIPFPIHLGAFASAAAAILLMVLGFSLLPDRDSSNAAEADFVDIGEVAWMPQSDVESVETDLENATISVYRSESSGYPVIWIGVEEEGTEP